MNFPCSNNEAKYEALILGLLATKERKISRLEIVEDSKLVILQTEGVYTLKELTLAPYRTTVQQLMEHFLEVSIVHKPRSESRFPDALSTMGAKTQFKEEKACIEIVKRFEPSIIEGKREKEAPEDWRDAIKSQLAGEGGTMTLTDLSQFVVL